LLSTPLSSYAQFRFPLGGLVPVVYISLIGGVRCGLGSSQLATCRGWIPHLPMMGVVAQLVLGIGVASAGFLRLRRGKGRRAS
jgi:hypothetical protein